MILINVFSLVVELSKSTAPVTRWAVYQISAAVAGVLFGAVLLLLNIAWQAIRSQRQIDHDIIDLIRSLGEASLTTADKIIDILRTLLNSVHATAQTLALQQKVGQLETARAELEKSGQGRLVKLLKRVLGD